MSESAIHEVMQGVEWRMRLTEWILSNLKSGADKETAVHLLHASLDEAYDEGVRDVAHVVACIRDAQVRDAKSDRAHVLTVAHRALLHLRKLNTATRHGGRT